MLPYRSIRITTASDDTSTDGWQYGNSTAATSTNLPVRVHSEPEPKGEVKKEKRGRYWESPKFTGKRKHKEGKDRC